MSNFDHADFLPRSQVGFTLGPTFDEPVVATNQLFDAGYVGDWQAIAFQSSITPAADVLAISTEFYADLGRTTLLVKRDYWHSDNTPMIDVSPVSGAYLSLRIGDMTGVGAPRWIFTSTLNNNPARRNRNALDAVMINATAAAVPAGGSAVLQPSRILPGRAQLAATSSQQGARVLVQRRGKAGALPIAAFLQIPAGQSTGDTTFDIGTWPFQLTVLNDAVAAADISCYLFSTE